MDDKLNVNKYFMIDSGTLLTNRKFQKDLDSVIDRATESGMFYTVLYILLYKKYSSFFIKTS